MTTDNNISQSEKKYDFFLNFEKVSIPHMKACLKVSGLEYVVFECAKDVFGNILPDMYSLWIPTEKGLSPKEKEKRSYQINRFFECSMQLSQAYEKYLIENVVPPEEYKAKMGYKAAFLGCEKVYFPDKVLKNNKAIKSKKHKENDNVELEL